MEHQTIKGIDIYNFPTTADTTKMLYWMGENYIDYIIDTFTTQFQKQDALTQIIAIKCEKEPEFETRVSAANHNIHAMTVTFPIQILLKDGAGTHWRLFGINQHSASGLDTENPNILAEFELERTEQL